MGFTSHLIYFKKKQKLSAPIKVKSGVWKDVSSTFTEKASYFKNPYFSVKSINSS